MSTFAVVAIGTRATCGKYIGDGVLAVFNAAHALGGLPRLAAFRAATNAQAALAACNATAVGEPPFDVGVALHVGHVAYGNIGAGDRLDFTAIGRDVNLVSRLERFCKLLGEPLLMAEAFVDGLPIATRDLGRHAFHGFATRRRSSHPRPNPPEKL